MNILRKNIVFIAVLAVIFTGGSLLLLAQCKRSEIYRNDWRPFVKVFGDRGFVPVIKDRIFGLTSYTIRVDLVSGPEKRLPENFTIQFCDKYSLSLVHGNVFIASVTDIPGKEAKTAAVAGVFALAPFSLRSKQLKLLLECDLIRRTVGIYINDVFFQKVFLGPEALRYAVNFKGAYVYLTKLKIVGYKENPLFNWDHADLPTLERLGRALFIIGWPLLCLLICYEVSFWRRALFIILVVVSLEGFLRNVKDMDPDYNINVAAYKWNFKTETDLFGAPDPESSLSESSSGIFGEGSAGMKPAGGKRIIIIGSSPVGGTMLLDPAGSSFPALLRKKLNPGGGNKVSVIDTSFPATYMQSLQCNIYFTEVLFKLKPDLVVFYSRWGENKGEIRKEQLLYDRARDLLERNADWIVSDRLLYAALEFKNPVKKIVCLYNSLCESYIFMKLENARKRIFNQWCSAFPKRPHRMERLNTMAGSYFEKMIRLCRENKIKLLLMPEVNFYRLEYGAGAEESIQRVIREHPEVYALSLRGSFLENNGHGFSYDGIHPDEFAHRIIAEGIFRKIMQDDLIGLKLKAYGYGTQSR